MRFKGFLGALKSYWLPILLIVFIAVVFISAPFMWAYRQAKALADKTPLGAALPQK